MTVLNKNLKKYAKLIVNIGLNIQSGKPLLITSSIENANLVREITKLSYEKGANHVFVEWIDDEMTFMKYKYESKEAIGEIPEWYVRKYKSVSEAYGSFLKIISDDPYLLKDIDTNKIGIYRKSHSIALKEHVEYIMSDKVSWCIVGAPSKGWAKRVFPNLNEEEAINKLWDYIFKTCRIDTNDPVKAWNEFGKKQEEKSNFLNDMNFKYLRYKSSVTDLEVELPEGHIWDGGKPGINNDGIQFIANIPTEEIYTMPKKDGVNGVLKATLPLNYNGNLIEDFEFTFKDGKIVDYKAAKGEDILNIILNVDEGSKYLGEVALVPHDSPISNLNTLFLNTLFDENASCHFAVGACYPTNIRDGITLSKEELLNKGGNDSLIHVDFMVGSKDLNIVGEKHNGEIVQIFKDGNWAF